MEKGDNLYYARIIPSCGVYDVIDMKVRMVEDNWFSCIEDRDKQAFIFSKDDIGKTVFEDRIEAVMKAKNAEDNAPVINEERIYEEY